MIRYLSAFLLTLPLSAMTAQAATGQRTFPACETLQRFGQVTDGLYHGSKPLTEGDFKCLKAMNIRTIVNIEDRILVGKTEGLLSKKYGITFMNVPMQPSPVPPWDSTVDKAMALISNAKLYPLYFHCRLGRDRTMLMMGLYENEYMGKAPTEAWRDMLRYGFSTSPTLWGLQHYFWDHVK